MKSVHDPDGPAEAAESESLIGPVVVSGGLVAKVRQVRQRLFPSRTPATNPAETSGKPSENQSLLATKNLARRSVSFQASIAEFFLVNRLRARSQQTKQANEILERASHIVFVTCKHWFAEENQKVERHETHI